MDQDTAAPISLSACCEAGRTNHVQSVTSLISQTLILRMRTVACNGDLVLNSGDKRLLVTCSLDRWDLCRFLYN
jgi:hypothetical protein